MRPLPASRGERFASGALVGGVIVFALITVALLRVGGGWVRAEMLTLLFALLAADLLIAVALLTGWYPVRPVAQGLAIFGAVVYLFVLLRSGPWWMRGWSGLLAAAHVYALVLLFALGSRERYEDDEDDGEDDEEEDRPEEPGVSAPAVKEPGATTPASEDEPIEVAAAEPESADAPAGEGVPDGIVDGDPTNDEHPADPSQTSDNDSTDNDSTDNDSTDNDSSDDETGEPDQSEAVDHPEPVETAVGTASARPTGERQEEA